MRVARHTGVDFIDANTHDVAFLKASAYLLQDTASGDADVACNLVLQRLDSYVFWDSGSSDVVNNQATYQATQNNSSDAYYNVVDNINWCGTTLTTQGCGWPIGYGLPFMITRIIAIGDWAGGWLAHEYGHTIGLDHQYYDLYQIMSGLGIDDTNNRLHKTNDGYVNSACNYMRVKFPYECPADSTGTVAAICSPLLESARTFEPDELALQGESASPAEDEQRARGDFLFNASVQELADSLFVDQVPYEAEDYYGEKDLRALRGMLISANTRNRANVATLIGLISQGSPKDLLALRRYLAQPGADVHAAMIAIGYLVSRGRNEEALDTLLQRFQNSSDAEAAALGLVVSGDPRAYDALAVAASRAQDPRQRLIYQEQARENERIGRIGIREHYRNPPAPVWLDVPGAEFDENTAAPDYEE